VNKTRKSTSLKKEHEQYRRVLEKMSSGEPITLSELEVHIGLQNRTITTGIQVGSEIPDLALPDQSGNIRQFDDLAGPAGLLLVFTRTVVWCPYCRNQAVELDRSYKAIVETGVNVALVTVDGMPAIRQFLTEHPVQYPILSDEQVELVRRFGIANEHIPEDSPIHRRGMPYPGSFLIGTDGKIRDKIVLDDYQYRPASTMLVTKHFGGARSGPCALLKADGMEAAISLSSAEIFTSEELGLEARVKLEPGWHVYGPSTAGQVAFGLEVDRDMFELRDLELPEPVLKVLSVANQPIPAYEDNFIVCARLRCRWSAPAEFDGLPGLQYLRDDAIKPGEYRLSGKICFQLCNDESCGIPQSVPFSIPVTVLPGIARPGLR